MPLIRTLVIKKKCRKYFECGIGKYKAKLLINEVSQHLDVGRTVQLHVKDISEHNKYGTLIKFEPVVILDECETEDTEQLYRKERDRKEAEKWLRYAEDDVKKGMSRTNAIKMALALCPWKHPYLSDRLKALDQKKKDNATNATAINWLFLAEQDINDGKYDTNAIDKAMMLCRDIDYLAERYATFKKTVIAHDSKWDDDWLF